MLPVRNTNLFQFVILLTPRTFNWLDLPKFLFFEVNCTYPIGGTPDLSNRRRQDGLNCSCRVGNTRWATQLLKVKSRNRKMFLGTSGFIFCQGLYAWSNRVLSASWLKNRNPTLTKNGKLPQVLQFQLSSLTDAFMPMVQPSSSLSLFLPLSWSEVHSPMEVQSSWNILKICSN